MESAFRSFSRPVLHAAARVVQEMGKSRAAAISVGLQDIDERDYVNTFSDSVDDSDVNESSHPEGIVVIPLNSDILGGRMCTASWFLRAP